MYTFLLIVFAAMMIGGAIAWHKDMKEIEEENKKKHDGFCSDENRCAYCRHLKINA